MLAACGALWIAYAQNAPQPTRAERFLKMSTDAETRGLAEPFKGITTAGTPIPGLFAIRSTGVSTDPVTAGRRGVSGRAHRARSARRRSFAVDDPEWRKWMNQHFYVRQGVSFKEMTEAQRECGVRPCCARR